MLNKIFLTGEIKKVTHIESKDPKKPGSAVVLVQYGKKRESSGQAVEFINAVMVRVPSYKYEKLKVHLATGIRVEIEGHLQGVVKAVMDEPFFMTELVADRVHLVGAGLEDD